MTKLDKRNNIGHRSGDLRQSEDMRQGESWLGGEAGQDIGEGAYNTVNNDDD